MQLVEHKSEFQARAIVWIINPQDVGETKKFKDKRAAPFVFLADENLDVVNVYGIYHVRPEEHGHIPYPVTFVVRPDGTIAWRFLGLQPRDRPKVDDVLAALEQL